MNRTKFIKIFVIELLMVTLIGGYFFIDSSDVYKWWVGSTNFVTYKEQCNLNESSCNVILSDGNALEFEINPKPIPLMKPLIFRVKTSDYSTPFIEIKLFATNMNMGFHTFKLYAKNNGTYEGKGMLPTCVVGDMKWQANIIINQPSKSVGAIFNFQTEK